MYNCAKYEKKTKKKNKQKKKQKRLPFEKIQVTMTQLLALETSVPKILNESSKICETIEDIKENNDVIVYRSTGILLPVCAYVQNIRLL